MSKDFTYTCALFNLFRNVMNYCYNKKFQRANVTAVYAYVAYVIMNPPDNWLKMG